MQRSLAEAAEIGPPIYRNSRVLGGPKVASIYLVTLLANQI